MPISVAGTANLGPYAPAITSPTSGSYADVSSGLALDWTYTPGTIGATQSAWTIRQMITGASTWVWWSATAGAWQSTEIFNTGDVQTYTLPVGALTDGNQYSFEAVVQDQYGTSAYSATISIVAQAAPTVTVSAPTGTVGTAQPIIGWTTTIPSGAVQVAYRVVVYSAAQVASSGFVMGTTVAIFDTGVVNGAYIAQVKVTGYLADGVAFVAGVQVTETGGQTSPWVSTNFSTSYSQPATPTLVATPAADVTTGAPVVSLAFQGNDNMVDAQTAGAGSNVGAWAGVSNCTVAIASVQPSVKVAPASIGIYATGPSPLTVQTPYAVDQQFPVEPGLPYTFVAWMQSGRSTLRDVIPRLEFSSGTPTSPTYTSFYGASVTEVAGGWVMVSVSATAPSQAIGADIELTISGALGPLSIPAAPTLTVEGAAGTTSYSNVVTVLNANGESLPSPVGTTTTGNATLDSTNYYVVGWVAVPLPAGSPGNLVYDSNLANAIAGVGATWAVSGTSIGTANGDMNVLNPGTSSAEIVQYGTGAAFANATLAAQTVNFIPGQEYCVAGILNATNVTTGSIYLRLRTASAILAQGSQAAGASGAVSFTYTVPAGTTSGYIDVYNGGSIVTAGDTISWSQIQLTQTSTVQAYEPGPLPTYNVYSDESGTEEFIGSTTALAFANTGQAATTQTPPTSNGTGDIHLIGGSALVVGSVVPAWTPGGFVGQTVAEIMASDDGGTTWEQVRLGNNVVIPVDSQEVTVLDWEATPGVERQYQAWTIDPTLGVESAVTTSAATSTAGSWWLIDPLVTSASIPIFVTAHSSSQTEMSTATYTLGNPFPTVVASTVGGSDGNLTVQTVTPLEYTTLQKTLGDQRIKWLISPFSDGLYARVGPQPGGMSSGFGNQTRQTTLSPSTSAAPVTSTAITYVEVARP
ncbi:MAG: hypothetical protein ACYDHP_00570 [Ferrimicrobium sp.]